MEPKVNYLIVGLFVLVLGVVTMGLMLWLGKIGYLEEYDRYRVVMRQSVSGLSVNSKVKYRGVDVGRVREIVLNPDNPEEVHLTLDILRKIPIKTDTVATLEKQGLTGLALLVLQGGSREASELTSEPGQPYPVIPTKPSLFYRVETIISRLSSEEGLVAFLTNLNAFSENANALINDETRKMLEAILADLSELSHVLAGQSRTIQQSLHAASDAMEDVAMMTSQVNQTVPELLERIQQSVTAVKEVTEDLAHTGKAVRTVVQDSRPNIQQFTRETLSETGQLVVELRQLTSTLQRVARQIERAPDSLIHGRPAQPRGPGE